MKELILENKELEKDLKEVFFSKKNILTDDEVKKECELGDKIVALLKEDIKEAGTNYLNNQQEIEKEKLVKKFEILFLSNSKKSITEKLIKNINKEINENNNEFWREFWRNKDISLSKFELFFKSNLKSNNIKNNAIINSNKEFIKEHFLIISFLLEILSYNDSKFFIDILSKYLK